MAEGDGYIYCDFKVELQKEGHHMESDDLKVALFTSVYVPDLVNDTLITLLSGECSGTGYVAGGEALTTKAVTLDGANSRAVFDADDITWTGLGTLSPQPAFAVLYNATTNRLIAYWEVATLTNGGNYTLQFSQSPSAILLVT